MSDQAVVSSRIVKGLISLRSLLGGGILSLLAGYLATRWGLSQFEMFAIAVAAFFFSVVTIAWLIGFREEQMALTSGEASGAPDKKRPTEHPAAIRPLTSIPQPQTSRVKIAWANCHNSDGMRATITNMTGEMLFPPSVMHAGLPQHCGMKVLVVAVRRWFESARAFVDVPGIALTGSARTRIRMEEPMFPDLPYSFPLVHFQPAKADAQAWVTIVGRSEDARHPPAFGQEGTWKVTFRAEFHGYQETHELCFRYALNRPPVALDSCPA